MINIDINYPDKKYKNYLECVYNFCEKNEFSMILKGSLAKGTATKYSDIDLIILGDVEYICYTPISQNIQDILIRKCIVFCGTKDKLFTGDDRKMILNNENTKLVQIENAVHSLEIDDSYVESIDILRRITDHCVEYIKERMIV